MKPISILDDFEEHARAAPNRTAVLDGRQALTYGELAAGAARVSKALWDAGVGRGDTVAFCLPRSVRCLTALLGILRAGAAYVPIDPKAPLQRTTHVLADCRPAAVICDSESWPLIRQVSFAGAVIELGAQPVRRDDAAGRSRRLAAAVPPRSGDDLAYVLYTSGSTGHPKGVMVSDVNIRSYTDWAIARFSIDSADRLLGTAPFHFDMSTFDLFCSLRTGATLCIASDSLTLFPEKLVQFMEKEGVTLWKGVSSLLMYLARAGVLRPGRLPALAQVLFGGEALPTRWLIEWMRIFPEKRFFNVYGPTEATGISLYHAVERIPAGADEKVPIGIPCSDTCVYLLDEAMQAVADGETGELYIGGAGVAQGYLNDAEKTARAFLPDPHRPGERMYRTGDLARWRPDGTYEFIGRRDQQVKVMGYRIELGEIEHALLAQPGVREAAVALVPAAGDGLEELVAFIDGDCEPAAVLDALKTSLPAYMVPRRLLPVGRLPRCGRGKIDRFALPALMR